VIIASIGTCRSLTGTAVASGTTFESAWATFAFAWRGALGAALAATVVQSFRCNSVVDRAKAKRRCIVAGLD
jgi:hypothetical protein